jgi:hypothetical protein
LTGASFGGCTLAAMLSSSPSTTFNTEMALGCAPAASTPSSSAS